MTEKPAAMTRAGCYDPEPGCYDLPRFADTNRCARRRDKMHFASETSASALKGTGMMSGMNSAPDNDESLVGRHARGDVAAFETLYRRNELRTWRFLERYTGSHSAADELMQDVWFTVAKEAANYQPTTRFAIWLFTITHNRVIERERASRHAGASAAPTEEEEASMLAKAMAQLPREQRESYLLQLEGDFTVQEIAAITNCAAEMAQARLHHARNKLRELLSE
jgi:RNA polymerase sigma factor (sigma-70 family)